MREWLRSKREFLGLTQEEIASRAHIQRAYYTMIESGRRNQSVKVAQMIAMELNFNWIIFLNFKVTK
ncbi:helix-turn-helix transcriptional regulator [Sporolactobacillus shoreicorticis]|uniref:Helix-turn-helix transcriptional regulator n=1 Tax=Sporolactobacillus shoreicorticis TaxID=1923877 RepID=A0ABW5RXL1_9BACL|nr:helix-turn-helix transcriptional regulator [Sporolactobacillus shoreicorticis]MCO7124769.1 helix-turn-helix transcriptional regulator [Sporolactobacillus shoreicorticis]